MRDPTGLCHSRRDVPRSACRYHVEGTLPSVWSFASPSLSRCAVSSRQRRKRTLRRMFAYCRQLASSCAGTGRALVASLHRAAARNFPCLRSAEAESRHFRSSARAHLSNGPQASAWFGERGRSSSWRIPGPAAGRVPRSVGAERAQDCRRGRQYQGQLRLHQVRHARSFLQASPLPVQERLSFMGSALIFFV